MRVLSIIHAMLLMGMAAMYSAGTETAGGKMVGQAMAELGFASLPAHAESSGLTTGEGQGEIRRIVIGLDLSLSNPLIDNDLYAQKVANRIAAMIVPLGFRSRVMLRTFGNYDESSNPLNYDAVISSRYPADQLANEIKLLIANIPALVRKGTFQGQRTTNIVGFLENMAQVIDCSAMPTTVILASDGLEDSEYARLKNANATLPAPESDLFAGCARLEILGIGRSASSPTATKRLRDTWGEWAQAAGFAEFAGLNDW